jgi:hypothetical protein
MQPTQADPPSAEELRTYSLGGRLACATHWARRNVGRAGMLAVVALLLTAAVGGVVSSLSLRRQRDAARDAQELAEEARQTVRRRAFEALVAQARASRLSRQVGQRFGTLSAVREAAALLDELDLPAEEKEARRDELRDLAVSALALVDVRSTPLAGPR